MLGRRTLRIKLFLMTLAELVLLAVTKLISDIVPYSTGLTILYIAIGGIIAYGVSKGYDKYREARRAKLEKERELLSKVVRKELDLKDRDRGVRGNERER